MSHLIQLGDLVEFVAVSPMPTTPGGWSGNDVTAYGVAVEDEQSDGSVRVEMADGHIYHVGVPGARSQIVAYAWYGMVPEGLEEAFYVTYNPGDTLDYGEYEDNLTDVEADADTLRSCGWGTDEDYGYFGGEDW